MVEAEYFVLIYINEKNETCWFLRMGEENEGQKW
jgi:hypothetical protein